MQQDVMACGLFIDMVCCAQDLRSSLRHTKALLRHPVTRQDGLGHPEGKG